MAAKAAPKTERMLKYSVVRRTQTLNAGLNRREGMILVERGILNLLMLATWNRDMRKTIVDDLTMLAKRCMDSKADIKDMGRS